MPNEIATMMQEINEAAAFEMMNKGIALTPENFITFLEGMHEAWSETDNPDSAMWKVALVLLISKYKFDLVFSFSNPTEGVPNA